MRERAEGVRVVAAAGLLLLAAVASGGVIEDLRAVEDQSTVELTTIGRRSGEPRRVTIWFVHDEGRVYVQSGKEGRTQWYRNLLAHPQVTLDFDGLRLEGQAQPVEDGAEADRVHDLFRRKYLTAWIMSWFGGGFGAGKVVLIDSLRRVEPAAPTPGSAARAGTSAESVG